MRYCTRCVLPDTRPGIVIDAEGVCTACRGHEDKLHRIDWDARRAAWDALVAEAKARSTGYDCIVPVSGGKDSWYQAIRARECGLKVLGVTWRTPARTDIGQRNLDNLIARVGIDHMDVTLDPAVERRFMIGAFERKGATAIPMHMALFAIPIRLAVQLRVPLVIWGENPQLEFGGSEADRLVTDLDLAWIRRHGVTNGTALDDWVGVEGLTARDLVGYRLPSDEEFHAFSPKSVFLGSFFRWNSFENTRIAAAHGFESGEDHLKTGVWAFADIDCHFIALHHFLKWYKFGILRSFDNLSVQIRYGMISRKQAIETLRRDGLRAPFDDIARFCTFAGKPEAWFWEVAETFRNTAIWAKRDGRWTIPGFLIEDWAW
ncbi:N-acetyl sugar amidotransferase [Azospirillum sp. Marseille-Q6669]